MNIQLLFLFGIFGLFVVMGVYIYLNYTMRKKFFDDVLAFCNHLIIEISFSKNNLSSIIERYSQTYAKHFRSVVEGYNALLKQKHDITPESLNHIMWARLKANERQQLVNFFYELGRHGCVEEHEKLMASKQSFQNFHASSVAALRKEASIYLKLCIIVGIGAVILLI